ncbi:TPA: hypothetical protein QDB15_002445 [Burkholderia vietnamiensis]|uniref:Uncharacterized protein n=1 Tax=Burkholderia vietnamiensis TaxID=60552 RepID=A0AA44Y2Y4_BURVI|nr:hypothetical protein [Burkholderia vietnamiensis]KVR82945.1 hypothetical protein WK27_21025 [Burkholderia vietnamiensis]KVS09614.1 hypothetical protein WK32_06000 [Burkholderia vietnamiensis]MCA8071846.1 hypothetical protein [Burkholderia vietnamiensis]MCA8195997.1 hypothetical protein [Burkholderia vietnamiensis]MCA8208246.1 hypothetical protein [Burkholderia vietnamiensis]
MKVDVEGGLYLARDGQLVKLYIEDDGTKPARLTPEVVDEVRRVQRRMRRQMAGRKPDIGDEAGAMLFAASAHDIDAVVAIYLTSSRHVVARTSVCA